jgi:Cytochrome c554 and c-prime
MDPMRFRTCASTAFALLAIPALLSLSAPQQPQEPQKGQAINHYIGAAQCKNCHNAKETGDQFGVWQKQKHSQAHATLATDKAKESGKTKGVAEPQKSEKCLKCHVTAFDRPKAELNNKFDVTMGVQCETCHGPGENHRRARMVAAAEADAKAKPGYTKIPDDEIVKSPDQKVCTSCHNEESPNYKPFDFAKFSAEIRHLNPQKPRTDAEKAALPTGKDDGKGKQEPKK